MLITDLYKVKNELVPSYLTNLNQLTSGNTINYNMCVCVCCTVYILSYIYI